MNNFDLEANDIEALLRSAGDYVRPSDDLRPAVLEQARVARAEWRAQSWVWCVALSVTVWVGILSQMRWERTNDFEVTPASSSSTLQREENPGWHTVERFNAVRRRQASLLFRILE